jgi:hypothetical protein
VTVSLVHFMRNLHDPVSRAFVRAAFKQSFSMLRARGLFMDDDVPDELHVCECVVVFG